MNTAPKVSAIVAYADLGAPDAVTTLEMLAREPRVRGMRQILNYDERDEYRCWPRVERHRFRKPAWQAGLARAAALGLSFDLQCNPAQMLEMEALLRAMGSDAPTVIIDHLGTPLLADENDTHTHELW